MCEEIEKMKKAERIKIAQRIVSSEKFTYDEMAYFTNLTLEKIKTLTNNEKGPAFFSRTFGYVTLYLFIHNIHSFYLAYCF